jgi:hypothetical protein
MKTHPLTIKNKAKKPKNVRNCERSVSLALALVLPALAQDKEADRVTNSGKVMKEILDVP